MTDYRVVTSGDRYAIVMVDGYEISEIETGIKTIEGANKRRDLWKKREALARAKASA